MTIKALGDYTSELQGSYVAAFPPRSQVHLAGSIIAAAAASRSGSPVASAYLPL